jgi:hypothetical protein
MGIEEVAAGVMGGEDARENRWDGATTTTKNYKRIVMAE